MDAQGLLDRWADAERTGDADALSQLIGDGFSGIGPHGFVLNRDQWLERFQHPFDVSRLTIVLTSSAEACGARIVTGAQVQEATYRGQPSDGAFTLTLIAHEDGGRAVVDHAQLSGPLPAR